MRLAGLVALAKVRLLGPQERTAVILGGRRRGPRE